MFNLSGKDENNVLTAHMPSRPKKNFLLNKKSRSTVITTTIIEAIRVNNGGIAKCRITTANPHNPVQRIIVSFKAGRCTVKKILQVIEVRLKLSQDSKIKTMLKAPTIPIETPEIPQCCPIQAPPITRIA